ncbi:hypothetical protein JW960_17660 [candidate division KSB1 bacterium]|nr:hypothetical protein [candidate division KSB1 bacterium]
MKSTLFWILAFFITITAAIYQRMTGPTYPVRGTVQLADSQIKFRLKRSHGGETDHRISIMVADTAISGEVKYKRYKTDDDWTTIPMQREDNVLVADLPGQPAAGKLQYLVYLSHNDSTISLTGDNLVVIRFKGVVPLFVLIPHIFFMFGAMLVSTRAAIEALRPSKNPRKMVLWTVGLLIIGGMILGPAVQHFAFDAWWTGFPFGTDLTDNKTLIALIGWIVALIAGRGGKPARGWVIAASVILMAVYLIPHSMFGSELDYTKMDSQHQTFMAPDSTNLVK